MTSNTQRVSPFLQISGRLLALFIVMIAGSPAAAGLVGHWPLDGSAADQSGLGNQGLVIGTLDPHAGFDGKANGALHLTLNGFIEVPASESLNISGELTVAAWIRPESLESVAFLRKYDSANNAVSWELAQLASGNLLFNVYEQGNSGDFGWRVVSSGPANLGTGTWQHLAAVYDPDPNRIEIYLNGQLLNGSYSGTPAGSIFTSPVPIQFFYPQGLMDEVRIYDHALTPEEIEVLATIPEPSSLSLLLLAATHLAFTLLSQRSVPSYLHALPSLLERSLRRVA